MEDNENLDNEFGASVSIDVPETKKTPLFIAGLALVGAGVVVKGAVKRVRKYKIVKRNEPAKFEPTVVSNPTPPKA